MSTSFVISFFQCYLLCIPAKQSHITTIAQTMLLYDQEKHHTFISPSSPIQPPKSLLFNRKKIFSSPPHAQNPPLADDEGVEILGDNDVDDDEEEDPPDTDLTDHEPPSEDEDTSLYPPFFLPHHGHLHLHLTAPPTPRPLLQHR